MAFTVANPIFFDLDKAVPGRMKMPRLVTTAIGGGVSLSGMTSSADISGGGIITVEYSDIQLVDASKANLRYWSWLAAITAGGKRPIAVPFMTDLFQPGTFASGSTPFSDGSYFSDGSGFAVPGISGKVLAAAASGSATLQVSIEGGELFGGEWFSIKHPTKGYRAYCVETVSAPFGVSGESKSYTITFRPTLREAVTIGTDITYSRPMCLMRVDPSTPIETDLEAYWRGSSSVKFVEYF